MTAYGFQGRLTAAFPSQILVDATEVCNLACTHCPHPTFKESMYYGGRALDPELNAKMVDEVRDHGQGLTQYIRYASNGEPLAHPQILEMMSDAAARSGTMVTLTTNGKILNAARAEKIVAAGVGLVDVSLDAHRSETYARIRVGGDLAAVRENVRGLIRRKREARSPLKVVVSFVEQPGNAAEAAEFEAYWKGEGADYVVVRRMHSCSGAMAELADARRDRNRAMERRPCLYPWERVVLNAMGFLGFCPSDWVHGSLVADYRNTTIQAEWSGPYYRALREAHLRSEYAGHAFCGQCPDWEATRWPDEGRSYANMVEDFKRND